jgi:hypothetical protein
MKYLCLIYDEEKKWQTMSREDGEALMQEYFTFTKDIRQSGHYLGGNDLQPTKNATTVRVRTGRLSTTDGPFAETKEQLGGFWVIEAPDLDAALAWAAKATVACRGPVEVRPFQDEPGA